jgi:hypothetical protein
VEDVQDEPVAAERVAGIDIGKAMVMATIRVPGAGAGAAGGRRPGSSGRPAGSC